MSIKNVIRQMQVLVSFDGHRHNFYSFGGWHSVYSFLPDEKLKRLPVYPAQVTDNNDGIPAVRQSSTFNVA